jgi:hypothetical protein
MENGCKGVEGRRRSYGLLKKKETTKEVKKEKRWRKLATTEEAKK